jgi:hypothetical protein
VSKTTGKPFEFRTQKAYAHTVDSQGNKPPYPEAFELILDDGAAPYSVGEYTLHPSSVYVDRNGRLAIGARLAPAVRRQGPAAA